MFLRRQDVIDRFDRNFQHQPDGEIIFKPPYSQYSAPISFEEYVEVTEAFEKRHILDMAVTWVVVLLAGGYGLHKVISEDDYSAFFIALGFAFLFSVAWSSKAYPDLLAPFMQRRDAMKAAAVTTESPDQH